jgi:hypothetical protein
VAWAQKEGSRAECEGFRQYKESKFRITAWSSIRDIPMAAVAEQVRLGRGLRMLSWCRMNALPTAARMAKAWSESKKPSPLPEEYLTECPCCREQVGEEGETVEHIVVGCSKWVEQRQLFIKPLMDSIVQQQLLPSTGTGICVLLLGGEYKEKRLSGWLPSSKKKQSEASTGHLGQEEVNYVCGAFRMARFLQAIERPRTLILRQAGRRTPEDGSPLQTQGLESSDSHG